MPACGEVSSRSVVGRLLVIDSRNWACSSAISKAAAIVACAFDCFRAFLLNWTFLLCPSGLVDGLVVSYVLRLQDRAVGRIGHCAAKCCSQGLHALLRSAMVGSVAPVVARLLTASMGIRRDAPILTDSSFPESMRLKTVRSLTWRVFATCGTVARRMFGFGRDIGAPFDPVGRLCMGDVVFGEAGASRGVTELGR